MRFACRITKATDTHTHRHTHRGFVRLTAFARQLWLLERASMLRCICIACLDPAEQRLRPGTHYPHVTWAHVMLRVSEACWHVSRPELHVRSRDVSRVTEVWIGAIEFNVNPLKPELNPICYLLVLLGVHHFLHVSRIRVKSLTFRLLMSYIYGAPILDVSRSHTTTQHSR